MNPVNATIIVLITIYNSLVTVKEVYENVSFGHTVGLAVPVEVVKSICLHILFFKIVADNESEAAPKHFYHCVVACKKGIN